MNGQRFASFAEVERLDAEALKALLLDGEPPERVWAAWALGLRHHEAFARELRATAAEEPHAGVRRHLVIVLAGAGERRSVLTMAAHDPDERVRATALQYVARLAGPKEEDANALLADVLARGAPLLRLGCIAGLRADARPALWDAVEACVASADRDLRWAAYEAAMRHGVSGRPASERAREIVNREPEASTRAEALRLLQEQAGAGAVQQLITDGPLDARVFPEAAVAFQAQGGRLPWAEVEKLIARFPADAHRALQLLAGNEGPARAALLQLFVASRSAADRSQGSWAVEQEVGFRLQNAFEQNRGPLDQAERRLRHELSDLIDRAVDLARADPDSFDDDDPDLLCALEREILQRLTALDVH